MSSHLYSETSAHLLAVTPTCHYLEYVDWANVLLTEPLRISKGHALIPERPGNGCESGAIDGCNQGSSPEGLVQHAGSLEKT